MSSTRFGRIGTALRLAVATVVLAAGVAGFATSTAGADAVPVQLDLAVVTSADAG
jgi:hypothetical protein